MSNVGAWDEHYEGLTEPLSYGELSYDLVAGLLGGVTFVEDWGCGGGAFASHLPPGCGYRGIDGSGTPYADEHVDLCEYRSSVPAIVLRHVLDHNDEWRTVLDNAVASFTDRLIIVLFAPLAEETHVAFREPDYHDVPVIVFRLDDILDRLPGTVVHQTISSPDTVFGEETIIMAIR